MNFQCCVAVSPKDDFSPEFPWGIKKLWRTLEKFLKIIKAPSPTRVKDFKLKSQHPTSITLLSKWPSLLAYILGHWITNSLSHTTYVMSVTFMHKWRSLQLKVDSERQLEKLLMIIFIRSLSIYKKSTEMKPPKEIRFFISFCRRCRAREFYMERI